MFRSIWRWDRSGMISEVNLGENRREQESAGTAQVVVYTEFPGLQEAAARLAARLSCDFTQDRVLAEVREREGLLLHLTEAGLSLEGGGLKLLPDFSRMRSRVLRGKLQHEFLAKVSRIKNMGGQDRPLYAIDATAGLGDDSFILAAAGYHVLMFERDPVIAALLEDSLQRAAGDPELAQIAGRMQVVQGDSIEALRVLAEKRKAREMPDLIYLDPMFPERRKSGLIGKKLQLLQKLERPCMEEGELLAAAFEVHPRRIVIKRPLKGPYLDGRKPHYSLEGKAIRYDCFTFAPDTGE